MSIELLYGHGTLKLDLPQGVQADIIRKPTMPVLADPVSAIENAIAQPVGAPPLRAVGGSGKSACILICDITRPVPNQLFLRPLIESLLATGIAKKDIIILVATGLHRPNLGDELAEVVGDPWVLANIKVVNHDATKDGDHVDLGTTPKRNVPVKIDRLFAQANIKIATGLVEPHFMAGYSGGRKVIAPGVAHQETIRTFHNSRFMADPAARNCNLDGNPLHEEQLAIVDILGGALALNTVIDEERRLAFVNFGEIKASHLQAVDFIRQYAEVKLDQRYDVIVTSSAGHPLDKTYYQTVKGMVGPINALNPGGDLIIASACSEGLGSKHYAEAQERLVGLGINGFEREIAKKPLADIDEWQSQMQIKAMRAGKITLVTDGMVDEHSPTGVEVTRSLAHALESSLKRHQSNKIAVIPEGPYVIATGP